MFLRTGAGGLALAGSAPLVLAQGTEPTEPSGELGAYGEFLARQRRGRRPSADLPRLPERTAATEDNILGPYYREGAPHRAKVTPPLADGDVLLVRGRVWAHDTRAPLDYAMLDIWQANAAGRYDNDDPEHPPAADVFVNRTVLVTDEQGRYEFETVRPGPYQIGERQWRPSHIHYMVRRPGYRMLVTQLYFQGDPHNGTDQFIKESLIMDVDEVSVSGGRYFAGRFDIVLAKE
jgi:catechol 1,2-dioxygenase